MFDYILVGIGAFCGGIIRTFLGGMYNTDSLGIPKGTLIANSLGAIIIGIVSALFVKTDIINAQQNILLSSGLCGGLTTFSTFSSETLTLFLKKKIRIACIYLLLSLILSILLVWVTYKGLLILL